MSIPIVFYIIICSLWEVRSYGCPSGQKQIKYFPSKLTKTREDELICVVFLVDLFIYIYGYLKEKKKRKKKGEV